MSGGIFVSYRRDDAKHAAGRLVDRLEKSFSRDQLFFDIDNIEPGVDFVRVLKEQVERCDVLLAIIGPGWLDARDGLGARRLDNPKDFVRIELETALARDIRVIPVLVDGARMPGEAELPEPLRALTNRQAVRLAHERFASEAEDLARALSKQLKPAAMSSSYLDSLKSKSGHVAPSRSDVATKASSVLPTVDRRQILRKRVRRYLFLFGSFSSLAVLFGTESARIAIAPLVPANWPSYAFWTVAIVHFGLLLVYLARLGKIER